MTGTREDLWRYLDDPLLGPLVVIDGHGRQLPYWETPGSMKRCERQVADTKMAASAPRMAACLRWLSAQVVGGRGGIPVCDMQAIAAAGAKGDDWRAVAEERATKRTAQRSAKAHRNR